MKQINTYINEKLRLTAKHQYTCQPEDYNELRAIIKERIKEDGPECDLNDIDVSKITNMSFLFSGLGGDNKIFKYFNGDISMWNVSNVKDMRWTFDNCSEFNCDISKWNVSNVTNISGMFNGCTQFNQDLDSWNVSKVKDMTYAFDDCPTQPKWSK
jgi:surface protein